MSDPERRSPRAVVCGCAGPSLTADERQFFREADPLGFILFARNCRDPDQVRALIGTLRESVGRADAPILIDQEGGRVVRLGPPHWRKPPAAAEFAALFARDPAAGRDAARANARLIAAELAALGITVCCAPVLDLPVPGAHDVIGDRAYGSDPEGVIALGGAVAEGLAAGGVLAVMKHIPGHGRAQLDSHFALPLVEAPPAELEATDFAPFHALRHLPWAMTAHVLYTALDPVAPATTSAPVIEEVIRGTIGFSGVLVSDDLSMAALAGAPGARVQAALAAGCDIALYPNADLAEMVEVGAATPPIGAETAARLARGNELVDRQGIHDIRELENELDALLPRN